MRETDASLRIAAIVPAAGRSGRMGTPKQLLDVDGKPMLVGIVEALVTGGADRVIVVAHSSVRSQLPPLPSNVVIVLNDDAGTEMIDSVRIGLASAPNVDSYLICPGDAARIAAGDVRRCIDAFAHTPQRIVIAAHGGRRGHPMIFPAALGDVVRSSECDAGLNQLARNLPQLVREVACDSPGTIANVNTPTDYQQLK